MPRMRLGVAVDALHGRYTAAFPGPASKMRAISTTPGLLVELERRNGIRSIEGGRHEHEAKKPLRSQGLVRAPGQDGFYYRSFLKNRGFPQDQFDGRPVIGICNTWSELTPCNAHFRTIAEHVATACSMPAGSRSSSRSSSLGEVTMRPTAMLFRNLAAMDVEEIDPRQPARRRGAADGLRQDHAPRC